jgi:hypothetical protein
VWVSVQSETNLKGRPQIVDSNNELIYLIFVITVLETEFSFDGFALLTVVPDKHDLPECAIV